MMSGFQKKKAGPERTRYQWLVVKPTELQDPSNVNPKEVREARKGTPVVQRGGEKRHEKNLVAELEKRE